MREFGCHPPAFFACACCSSDAVEVLRELARHVVVDNSLDSLDVQTAGGKISGHQEVDCTVAEELQSSETLYMRAASSVTLSNNSELNWK